MENIVILTQPRSGSTLLCELFEAFKSTRVIYEIFTPQFKSVFNFFEKQFICGGKGLPSKEEFANFFKNNLPLAYQRTNIVCSNSYLVYKIFQWQADLTNIDFLFDNPNNKFIILTRSNSLAWYASEQLSSIEKIYIPEDDPTGTKIKNFKINLDLKKFENWHSGQYYQYLKMYTSLVTRNLSYLHINYENDLESLDGSVFLKIKKWGIENSINFGENNHLNLSNQKMPKRDLSEIYLNWDEISRGRISEITKRYDIADMIERGYNPSRS